MVMTSDLWPDLCFHYYVILSPGAQCSCSHIVCHSVLYVANEHVFVEAKESPPLGSHNVFAL